MAPGVYELRFRKPEGFSFQAGQFVLFDTPHPDNPPHIQPRAYSIGSAPSEDELIFAVKLTPGGRFSRYTEEKLNVGGVMTMKGPLGLFVLKPEQQKKPYLFIATGAGNAPFRSQIKWLLEEKKETRQVDFVFGVRFQRDLFWHEEFEQLAKRFANFHFHPTLSGDEPAWQGLKGRVVPVVSQTIKYLPDVHLFVCGAPPMVQDVKKVALEHWGVPKAEVHAEGYI